ncbi:Zinc finger protein on ecdysone puffs [Frankliniella fusca]|uniref:Zinc finger protein on ecdysone puffs n=1 Tax=Frankliniella fusca TaxID=407009 RepID=A0AAE1LF84_9NEOP|nr:Zinc finger protein on ecdysone puffs [Frankliniella fusca]
MANFQGGRKNPRNFNGPGGDISSSANTRGQNRNINGALLIKGPQNQDVKRVNPWQPGVAPGNRSSGGLLPTPPGLLQQPGTMQNAQLAVANNVLGLLLPNQNQMPPLAGFQPNRGGLLPPNPRLGFPNLNFGSQGQQHGLQGFNSAIGQGNQNSLGPNRPHPLLLGKRPEPYNKMGNRYQREGQKNVGRKDANSFPRNAGRNAAAGSKNNNHQSTNTKERKEDARDGKPASDVKCIKKSNDVQIEKESYTDIPSHNFYCHVCPCKMWDSDAFTNHVKSKSHQSMMNRLEEKYKKEAEVMRQDMQAEEKQKQISEVNQRRGKPLPAAFRTHCLMCNLHFYGNLIAHRKGSRHQNLKAFLHPTCQLCTKEFASRIDYDHHLLSAGHLAALKKETGKCVKQGGEAGLKNMPEQTDLETNKSTAISTENVQKTLDVLNKTASCDKVAVAKPGEKDCATVSTVSKPPIIPNFDSSKEIGMELLQEKTGYLCKCCNRFLSTAADAKIHCRSRFHYDKYVAHMDSKAGQSVKLSMPDESLKPPKTKANSELTTAKPQDSLHQEDEDNDDEGNWKRRRVLKEEKIANNVPNDNQMGNPNTEDKVDHKSEEKIESSSEVKKLTTDDAQEVKSSVKT